MSVIKTTSNTMFFTNVLCSLGIQYNPQNDYDLYNPFPQQYYDQALECGMSFLNQNFQYNGNYTLVGIQSQQIIEANLSNIITYYWSYVQWSPPNATQYALQIIDNFSNYGQFNLQNSMFYIQDQQYCVWVYNQNICNCVGTVQWYQEFLQTMQQSGIDAGILTDANSWAICSNNSNILSNYNLFYEDQDNEPNFNDFTPFGGWTTPTLKNYMDYLQYPTSCPCFNQEPNCNYMQ